MFTLILGIILPLFIYLLIGLFILVFKRPKLSDYFDIDNFNGVGAITIITTILAVMVAFLLPYKTHEIKSSYQLESLEDGNYTNGAFFLGCGMVNETMRYTFFYNDNGYYKMQQIGINNTKIKYSDKPRLIVFTTLVNYDDWYNRFVFGFGYASQRYVLCVPKGTIKNNYNLDTK